MATTTINLQRFCDPDENGRYALNEPWVVNGWRYATDGRVIVRVPAEGEQDSPLPDGKRRPKNPGEILRPVNGEWLTWPNVSQCYHCEGTGTDDCPGCPCGACSCLGEIECTHCRAKGTFRTLFGKAELSQHYAYLISKLPGVMYLPQTDPEGVVRFKFDGGEGGVSPVRKD